MFACSRFDLRLIGDHLGPPLIHFRLEITRLAALAFRRSLALHRLGRLGFGNNSRPGFGLDGLVGHQFSVGEWSPLRRRTSSGPKASDWWSSTWPSRTSSRLEAKVDASAVARCSGDAR